MSFEKRAPGHAVISYRSGIYSVLRENPFYRRSADNDIEVF
jgi:hypothetical protein